MDDLAPDLTLDLRLRLGALDLTAVATLPGGVAGLAGPSGAGKTTLLRVIAGLERGATGTVALGDEVWQGPGSGSGRFVPAHRRRAATVFQDARLFPHMSVARNVSYGARRGGSEATAERMVEALRLGPLMERRPASLSGGEARRVALARALAAGPRIVLLDEPTAGLDAGRRDEALRGVRAALGAARCPAVLVSHDPRDVAALASSAWTIEGGALRRLPGPDVVAGEAAGGALRLGGVSVPWAGPPGPVRLWLTPATALLSAASPGAGGVLAALPARAGDDGGRLALRVGHLVLGMDRPAVPFEAAAVRWLSPLPGALLP